MLKKFLTILLSFCCFSIAKAQDIHWSQFNDNPIFQNPANSGRFVGSYRFIANYRNQWQSVTVPFSTFSFSADTRIQKVRNLSLGILLFHDVEGDGKLRTVEFQVAPSYTLKLSSDSVNTLRFGLQLGLNHRQVVTNNFHWDSQFNGLQYDASLPSNEEFQNLKKTNFSTGVGVVYEWAINPRKRVATGIGFFNINAPNQGFLGEVIHRDRRLNVFAQGQFAVADDWDVLPTFQLNFQGKYNEVIFGANARYILQNRLEKYLAIYFGAYFRNRDAGYLSVGCDYKDWFLGISYDLNFSKLVPASRVRGGFELAARYILNISRPKNILYRVCPDFI